MELYQSAAPWLRILGMNALNRVGAKLKKTWFLVQFHLRFPKTVGGGGGKCLPTPPPGPPYFLWVLSHWTA